jgi:exopolysaccharide biosynthesis WecB/TagA/CpsF family protein
MTSQKLNEKIRILNIDINNISIYQLLQEIKKGGILFTPNVDHLVKLQKDGNFYKVYQKANYVVCDSKILFWTSKFLGRPIQEKISGSDFFTKFYSYYKDDESIKIFLLGGTNEVAEQAKEKINTKVNRTIVIGAYSPTLGFEKNEAECQKIIELINNSGVTVLAIGVGAPKQEKWIDKYKEKLPKIKIFLAIGAAIDFESGIQKRAPKWMSNVGLEWLHRLILNPRRLWRRYLVESWLFFWLIFIQFIQKINYKFKNPSSLNFQGSNLLFLQQDENNINNQIKKRKITVAMLGPNLSEKGGMGAVQQQIINGINEVSDELVIKHTSIWDGKTNTLVLFVKALIFFLNQLIKNQVDIVHLHMSERGSVLRHSILALLSFTFSKPVIIHAHGCEFHLFYDNLPKIIQQGLNKVLQNCAYIIALSKSWQNTYINKCNLKAEQALVLYNPVVLPKFIPKRTSSDKITFLFLGKINERKGIFDLFEALALLSSNTQKKVELIIAGDGEIEKAINIVKKLDIEFLITFAGWVNIKQRDELLEKADVFVLPSYNEGLPMALLEAMSWSLPVITTPVGGITEVVTHNETGLLIEPGNIEQLAESMQTLIDDESLRLSLGNAARERANLLNLQDYTHELLNVYYSSLAIQKNANYAKIKEIK